jgi:hypothetical protein
MQGLVGGILGLKLIQLKAVIIIQTSLNAAGGDPL